MAFKLPEQTYLIALAALIYSGVMSGNSIQSVNTKPKYNHKITIMSHPI